MRHLAGLLLFPMALAAGNEVPVDHFSRGFRMSVDGNSAIYQLPLPAEVYQAVVRSDLGDIRVFNGVGEAVPHAIRTPEVVRVEGAASVVLPFFPIRPEVQSISGNPDVDIEIAGDGTIIHIRPRGDGPVVQPAGTDSYIIDISTLKQSIDQLKFELTGAEGSFIKHASLQYSDDLTDWYPLVPNATLARLEYGNHSLERNLVPLPGKMAKYLRFDWKANNDGIQISAIHAKLDAMLATQPRQWSEVDGTRSGSDGQIIEYDTGGQFPVDRIELLFAEGNTLIEAVLSSRKSANDNWRTRYSGVFYKLQVKDGYFEQESTSVGPTTDRYWQLQVKTEGGMGSQVPKLKFAWTPNDLYFLARGAGPFTLAFGNGQVGAPGRPIDVLMKVLGNNKTNDLTGRATLGEEVELMGEAALAKELVIPWQRIMLWTILAIGVLVIALMAARLIRQMNASP